MGKPELPHAFDRKNRSDRWRIARFRSGSRHENPDPEQHDHADEDPRGRDVQQVRRDAEADDQDDEANEIGAEGRHCCLR